MSLFIIDREELIEGARVLAFKTYICVCSTEYIERGSVHVRIHIILIWLLFNTYIRTLKVLHRVTRRVTRRVTLTRGNQHPRSRLSMIFGGIN